MKQVGSIMNDKIEMIIFDLGGVLFDWNPRYLFKKIFNDDTKMEHFLKNVCNHEWNLCQDKGRPFSEGIALVAKDFPEYKEAIEAYNHRWIEMIGGTIESTVELLKELKAK